MLLQLSAPVMAVRKLSKLLLPVCVFVLDLIDRASVKSTEVTDGLVLPALLSVDAEWKEGLSAGEGSGSLGGGNGGGPKDASEVEARKLRDRARLVWTGVTFDPEAEAEGVVGVRRSSVLDLELNALAAEVEAALLTESDVPTSWEGAGVTA